MTPETHARIVDLTRIALSEDWQAKTITNLLSSPHTYTGEGERDTATEERNRAIANARNARTEIRQLSERQEPTK
jgi:hypothetical protein